MAISSLACCLGCFGWLFFIFFFSKFKLPSNIRYSTTIQNVIFLKNERKEKNVKPMNAPTDDMRRGEEKWIKIIIIIATCAKRVKVVVAPTNNMMTTAKMLKSRRRVGVFILLMMWNVHKLTTNFTALHRWWSRVEVIRSTRYFNNIQR